jgi:hypothetical protein
MGFLTINGTLVTYDEYKQKISCYKQVGLRQFAHLYQTHKDRHIERDQLHFGEEIEYNLYWLDEATRTVKLACDAADIIASISEEF